MTLLATACALLSIGLYGVLTRRDLIAVLGCLEIVTGSVILLLVTLGQGAVAEATAVLLLVVAAVEASIGFSLLLRSSRQLGATRVDEYTEVRES